MILHRYNSFFIAKYYANGASAVALMVSIALFCGLILSVSQWVSYQQKQAAELFQRQQAILIAHNQAERQRSDVDCQSVVVQNHIRFQIKCGQTIKVKFPLGEVSF